MGAIFDYLRNICRLQLHRELGVDLFGIFHFFGDVLKNFFYFVSMSNHCILRGKGLSQIN